MRDIRLFQPGPRSPGEVFDLEEAEARHLVAVLRRGVGAGFLLLDGEGHEYEARVVEAGKRGARAEVVSLAREAPPPRPVVLALALLKSPSFEETLERATELGMTRFLPVEAERSIVEVHGDRAEKKSAKWQRACAEALKQCERLWLPRIESPAPLSAMLEHARREGWAPLLLRERAPDAPPLARRVAALDPARGVMLLVGPEGGWTPSELEIAEQGGALSASLGDAILRAETAALAALAITLESPASHPR